MIQGLFSTVVSCASMLAVVPLMGDDGDKALSLVMIILAVIQIIMGMPPSP